LLAAALLLAACAAPQSAEEPPTAAPTEAAPTGPTPFTPQEIANMTQGLETVGDFFALVPAAHNHLHISRPDDYLHISFFTQQYYSIELRVQTYIKSDGVYHYSTLPDELLAAPAQLVTFGFHQPNLALVPPRGIDVGAPAQAVLDSFAYARVREDYEGGELIALQYPLELMTIEGRVSSWAGESFWLSYHLKNGVVNSIFFRHHIH
jgi:hypothetical protein